jgi:hypothetical protein
MVEMEIKVGKAPVANQRPTPNTRKLGLAWEVMLPFSNKKSFIKDNQTTESKKEMT